MATTSITLDDPLKAALARVAELEAEIKAAQQAAQAAKQELQYFIFAANHDLLEPLRAITTYSQLLERRHSQDVEDREITGFIVSGVERMKRLLENLVAYSRLDPAPAVSTVQLDGVAQAAQYKLGNAIKAAQAILQVADLPEIYGHEGQITQLFEHLISNSLLYRRAEAPVIEIAADEGEVETGPAMIVKVKDNGVGIPLQYFGQVLQPFKRLHGKDIPGNGLGLAICDKIMRAHKGKLWIESDGSSWTRVNAAFPL